MCVRVFNRIVKCAEENTVLSSREGNYYNYIHYVLRTVVRCITLAAADIYIGLPRLNPARRRVVW